MLNYQTKVSIQDWDIQKVYDLLRNQGRAETNFLFEQ